MGKKEETDTPEVKVELSKISLTSKRNLLIIFCIICVCALVIFVIFNSFYTDDVGKQKNDSKFSKEIESFNSNKKVIDVPAIPELVAPTSPPAIKQDKSQIEKNIHIDQIPVTQTVPSLSLPVEEKTTEDKEKLLSRRKSSIMAISGEASPSQQVDEYGIHKLEDIQDSDFAYKGDLEYLLTRGKIINAVLENALNTDFGGEIRAIITKDVFGQSGKTILIPKGSRAIGSYDTSIGSSYGRIEVVWSRIDLTNGYVVKLNSAPSVDNLGKAGVPGRVDLKIKEQITNSLLVSVLDVLIAKGLDKITPPVDTSVASQSSATSTAILNFVSSVSSDTTVSDPGQKIEKICSGVPTLITNNSDAILQVAQACTIAHSSTGDVTQRLTTLTTSINTIASSLLQAGTSLAQESQTQKSMKDAYKNVTDTIKTVITKTEFKPTITVEQGKLINIYVNKDFVFPKAIVNKINLLK